MPYYWAVHFHTYKSLSSLPRLLHVAAERQTTDAYRCEGRYRQEETHCLFKYTLAGEGIFLDADGEHRVPAGTGFLCEIRNPDTAYYYPHDASTDWEFIYACLDGPMVTAMVHDMTERFGPLYTLPREGGVIERLLGMQRLADLRLLQSPSESALLAMEILTALVASKEHPAIVHTGNQLIYRAQDVIRQHVHTPFTATQLAAMLEISREHLTRVFQEHLGQTPYQCILREKMLLACRLLKDTNLSIQEISLRTGCESQALFTHRFKSVLKMSPSVFRKVGTVPIR